MDDALNPFDPASTPPATETPATPKPKAKRKLAAKKAVKIKAKPAKKAVKAKKVVKKAKAAKKTVKRKPAAKKVVKKAKVKPAKSSLDLRTARIDLRLSQREKAMLLRKAAKQRRTITSLLVQWIEELK